MKRASLPAPGSSLTSRGERVSLADSIRFSDQRPPPYDPCLPLDHDEDNGSGDGLRKALPLTRRCASLCRIPCQSADIKLVILGSNDRGPPYKSTNPSRFISTCTSTTLSRNDTKDSSPQCPPSHRSCLPNCSISTTVIGHRTHYLALDSPWRRCQAHANTSSLL